MEKELEFFNLVEHLQTSDSPALSFGKDVVKEVGDVHRLRVAPAKVDGALLLSCDSRTGMDTK
eukprot:CAMPEP_0182799128 /NCGR_PEP_ID=MMETSP0006_2-20121128/1719_1 /TAXON_ID=97485 /ORGANISM="Prymnesium parvum, Strain Texoma1" /LENGTH=62 /DNA_ID=CAMNT_0024924293 /DNA_START=419 /DNA_END=607 /DNA_ORIENTATION=+